MPALLRIDRGFDCPLSGRLLLLVLLALLFGCRGTTAFQASSLPADFRAPRNRSARSLSLSQLARPSYRSDLIQAGDLLDVSIVSGLEQGELPARPVRVADNGTAMIPLVGPVQLGGLELPESERLIRDESIRRGIYQNPQVSVQLTSRRTNRITVMGAVEEPGVIELPAAQSDLLAALVAAGGMSEDAEPVVEIRSPRVGSLAGPSAAPGTLRWASYATRQDGTPPLPAPQAARVDLEEAIHRGQDLQLADGSTVMVLQKTARTVYVMGLVTRPGQIELPLDQEFRLLDAIAEAGGRTLQQADKVKIIRNRGDDQSILIAASVREAKRDPAENLRLMAGDVISVEETPLTFTIEMLRSFIRFGFSSTIPGV